MLRYLGKKIAIRKLRKKEFAGLGKRRLKTRSREDHSVEGSRTKVTQVSVQNA